MQQQEVGAVETEGLAQVLQQALFLYFERAIDVAQAQQVQHRDRLRASRREDVADPIQLQVIGLGGRMQRHLAFELIEHGLFVGVEKPVGNHDIVGQAK